MDDILKSGRARQYDEQFKRLADTFQVDVAGLAREFWDHGSRAELEFKKAKISNQVAWSRALAKTSAAAARARHPVINLQVALAEYVCISASDSIIEHDFSRIKKVLGEHRLNAKEDVDRVPLG